jgi:hypothetical protein
LDGTIRGGPGRNCFKGLHQIRGHPNVRELLAGETMLAKDSPNLTIFKERVDREYFQYGETLPLPFLERLDELIDALD